MILPQTEALRILGTRRSSTASRVVLLAINKSSESWAPLVPALMTSGTSNVTSSIYAVRFGPDMLSGIQTAPVSVRDLGEIDAKPALRTRIEWYSGVVIKHPRAAARLSGGLKPN